MIFAESARLILRRPRPEDYEPLLASWSHPEISRYTPDRADLRGFIRQMIVDMQAKRPGDTHPGGPWYQFVAERREDGALVGDLGVGFWIPGDQQVELGYRIVPEAHRNGYGREATALLIDYLVEHHDIHRFVGIAAAPNEASKALLRSLGFRHEGHFIRSFNCHGEWLDDDYFALLASEWRSKKAAPGPV